MFGVYVRRSYYLSIEENGFVNVFSVITFSGCRYVCCIFLIFSLQRNLIDCVVFAKSSVYIVIFCVNFSRFILYNTDKKRVENDCDFSTKKT